MKPASRSSWNFSRRLSFFDVSLLSVANMKPLGFLRGALVAVVGEAGADWADSDEANGAVAASAAVERRNERRFMGGGGDER